MSPALFNLEPSVQLLIEKSEVIFVPYYCAVGTGSQVLYSLAIDTDAVVGSPRLSVVVAQLAGMYYL